jgi:peptidoglycan-N-acetylglucosamine deacetylase
MRSAAAVLKLGASGRFEGSKSPFNPSRYFSAGDWLPEARFLPSRRNQVAITFDDGPTEGTTPKILDLLAERRATATFFLTGARAVRHPHLVRAIVDARHCVYGHGWEHVHYDKTSPAHLIRDLERCERYLSEFRPTPSPYLVRLPYTAGHRSAWVHRALRQWRPDVQLVHYSATLRDWLLATGCKTRGELQDKVNIALESLPFDKLPGKVLLLHEAAFDAEDSAGDADGSLNAAVGPMLLEGVLAKLASQGTITTNVIAMDRQSTLSKYVLVPRWGVVSVG